MKETVPVRKIVIAGALGAVSIVLFLTKLGFISWIQGISLTVMHVPVIIGAVIEGPLVGGAIGLIFGVTSLIQAATAPNGPGDVFFVNPLVSVAPRILVGVAAWAVYAPFRGKLPAISLPLAGVVGSLTNSVLVLGALVALKALPLPAAAGIVLSNGLIEAVVAAVLTTAVVTAWKGIASKGGVSRVSKEG
ncbi:MAG: ECF transporter S component [Spirochaetes bacterium]|nr:ECF transporter S component [Spirochaetota bacterium]